MDYAHLEEELQQAAMILSQRKLVHLRRIINHSWRKRFKISKGPPKYGSLNMAFNDQELDRFLTCVKYEKLRLLFKFQAFLGLRIGEAVRVRLQDINTTTREITIQTEKTGLADGVLYFYFNHSALALSA